MPEARTVARQRELTYIQAVTEALRWALEEYPEALVFGEDMGLPGGPYGATKGLRKQFGERVFDTPISESAIIGAAVGAAMRGMRPIVEIMFADFFLVALDQVVNQAANVRYVSRGRFGAPLTIRSQQAATPGACAQHSQSLEALFCHIPGVRVCLPSTPADAYQLLRSAIACDDPVVVLESRALYPSKAPLSLDAEVEPIGGSRLVRTGRSATLVSWGRTAIEAVTAADVLAEEGIEVDVIDLRWLAPLDFDAVAASVARTSRLVIAHEANITGGFGAELAARAARECFWDLDAPVERVGLPDTRVPAAPSLQQVLVPDATAIEATVRRVIGA
ncbi:MAG TPA: transketolase C-terminal domain-containing protein [Gaiellaceae bacterium]|nr:transketolase C-terminal domain-containing protein [Gaiellaceae bacterium]